MEFNKNYQSTVEPVGLEIYVELQSTNVLSDLKKKKKSYWPKASAKYNHLLPLLLNVEATKQQKLYIPNSIRKSACNCRRLLGRPSWKFRRSAPCAIRLVPCLLTNTNYRSPKCIQVLADRAIKPSSIQVAPRLARLPLQTSTFSELAVILPQRKAQTKYWWNHVWEVFHW